MIYCYTNSDFIYTAFYSWNKRDPDYLQAVGQALYNFTYLELVVVWTIVKLSADGFQSVPKGKPAGHIQER